MSCYIPLEATKLHRGGILIHPKYPPRTPTPPHIGVDIKLPCGRCIGCKIEKARNWTIRCLHESQLSERNAFLTLTYASDATRLDSTTGKNKSLWTIEKSGGELPTNAGTLAFSDAPEDANVDNSPPTKNKRAPGARSAHTPLQPEGGEGRGLSKRDHQKFLKRLREAIGPLRYYMCGEYGKKLSRPHYHYLIFGNQLDDRYLWKRSESGKDLYRSATLEEAWPFGYSWIGNVTYETCAYVAGYVTKKITGELAHEHYRRTDDNGVEYWLMPEFNEMSRRPGIGKQWWNQFKDDVTVVDAVVRKGGKLMKPPRYYDNLLEQHDPLLREEQKHERIYRATNLDPAEFGTDRMTAKEAVAKARLVHKKRNYEETEQ